MSAFEVSNEVGKASDLFHGQTTVGLEAVQITNLTFKGHHSILLRCPGTSDPSPTVANTASVWVGGRGVTPQNGMPIIPGNHLVLPVDDLTNLYVVSTSDNQNIAWMGV